MPERTLEVRNLTVAIKNIARACGDEISDMQPILDARLEDGSRVAAMFPPCSVDGPTLTVRKFTRRFTLEDLVAVGTVSEDLTLLLRGAVDRRQNILISGGTGTGRTTVLNALAETIPPEDRVVLIEETSEIRIDKPNLVRFEARRAQAPLDQEVPVPAVSIADLVRATLRHRPDRIIVGEVRGAEAFDLLQALNTGHLGSLTTIHGNAAEQALTRLAHCVLTANVGLPHRSVREAIALAIHLSSCTWPASADGGWSPRSPPSWVTDQHTDRFLVEPKGVTARSARRESFAMRISRMNRWWASSSSIERAADVQGGRTAACRNQGQVQQDAGRRGGLGRAGCHAGRSQSVGEVSDSTEIALEQPTSLPVPKAPSVFHVGRTDMATHRRNRHTCLQCQKRRSVFHYRGRVRADRTHTLCPRCYRAITDSQRLRTQACSLVPLAVGTAA